jgi:cytochrome bd ubiquinol oxidase subunit II
VIRSIAPFWDGNEVWLLTAGGATFAAFPQWYATLFSGFYLPLLLILLAPIVRGVAFQVRHQRRSQQWKKSWDVCIFVGSALPALLWGVAFADMLKGVPINAHHEYTGNFFNLLQPYALLGGLTTLLLFTMHGSIFLSIRTKGDIAERARAIAWRLSWPVAAVVLAFLAWTYVNATAVHDTGVVPSFTVKERCPP